MTEIWRGTRRNVTQNDLSANLTEAVDASLKCGELLPEGEIFEGQIAARTDGSDGQKKGAFSRRSME